MEELGRQKGEVETMRNQQQQEAAAMSTAGEPKAWAVFPEPRTQSHLTEARPKVGLSKRSQSHWGGAISVGSATQGIEQGREIPWLLSLSSPQCLFSAVHWPNTERRQLRNADCRSWPPSPFPNSHVAEQVGEEQGMAMRANRQIPDALILIFVLLWKIIT